MKLGKRRSTPVVAFVGCDGLAHEPSADLLVWLANEVPARRVSPRGVALKTSHVVNGQAVCASVFRRAWSAGGAIEVTDRVRLLVLVGCAEGASVSGWAWWAGGLREVTGSGCGARKALVSS